MVQDQVDNILVIDDEPGIRTTMAAILEDEGYNVVTAEDGYKGIEEARKTNIKIAFIDLKMPGINGIETYKEIKKINSDTVVFLMTAFFAEDLLQEAVKLGVRAVFYKPLDIDLILRAIRDDLTKTNILVVDDEFSTRETLKGVLEDRGYNVTIAEDGDTAIEMVKKSHFDIMFMDVMMPGIDGFKTLEEVKKVDPKTKVIIMTGQDIESLVENAISRGASTCIAKPINDMGKLLKLLQAIKEDLVRINILVVDDEFSTRETLRGVLEEKGYQVAVAEDGHTAIEMVKKSHFDIIFMDVMMPGIDGFKTLEEIKKVDPKTKLVMMTGHDIEDLIEKAVSRGAFASMSKPIDMVELLQLVIKAVEK